MPPTYFSLGLVTSPSAKPETEAGMPYATQWVTPPGGRSSGSTIRRAKLLVPSGAFDHDSVGDMFWPRQFGLALLLPAFFSASRSPSLKSGDDSVNAPCARASRAPHNAASASMPAKIELRENIPPPGLIIIGQCNLRRIEIKFGSTDVRRRLRRLRVALQHFIPQHTPDLAVQRVKLLVPPH